MNQTTKVEWIGLFNVRAQPAGEEPYAPGYSRAFVNVVANAVDAESFVQFVISEMNDMDFDVLGFEDVETVVERELRKPIDGLLQTVIQKVRDGQWMAWGDFNSYPDDEE
ncbi:MAG: hypothetical protein AAFS11_09980 [Planctomycetota bacterium]